MILIDKNDVLLKINDMLRECEKNGLNKYKNKKVYKILLFLKNLLTVENIKTAKGYIKFENNINTLVISNIEIMNIKFEDKILDENKIIVDKLTNNTDPYFYIRTDIRVYSNNISAYFDIFVDNFSSRDYVFQRLSLEDKFKPFIKKEPLIGTKTIIEYIADINQKTYDIKNCFLNMDISKDKLLGYLYKSKIDDETIEKITCFSDVFFSSNDKMTIYNLYKFIENLVSTERSRAMYIISNIVCN